jgi:flagellar motility protein MotE (MotC chaperone)
MKASVPLLKYASSIAAKYPEVAFDLTSFAFKLAEDEQKEQQGQQQAPAEQKQAGQIPEAFKENIEKKKEEAKEKEQGQEQQKQAYQTLKSVVIRTAAADPSIRQALLPILKTIKQLG